MEKTPEGADVVDVIDDRDVLVRRVVGGSGVARAEPRDRDAERVAHLRHRTGAGEKRVYDRLRAVRAAACIDRRSRGDRVGGPARWRLAVPGDDLDVFKAAPIEMRAQEFGDLFGREIGDEAEVDLRAGDRGQNGLRTRSGVAGHDPA